MDLRVQLIQGHDDGHSISELADLYRDLLSASVYKWLERHATEGIAGLAEPQPDSGCIRPPE